MDNILNSLNLYPRAQYHTAHTRYHPRRQVSTYTFSTFQVTTIHHIDVDLEAQTSATNPLPLLTTHPSPPTPPNTVDTDVGNDELLPPATAANGNHQVGLRARVLNIVRNASWGGVIGTAAAVCTIVSTALIIHW
ncbi:hypothetical protein DL93DRAFT_1390984 [Clavulina sp. PMI_390]|nr:hypothetical protein DL93DRAFT_1390984 [Clavulina sp. PMI_390]